MESTAAKFDQANDGLQSMLQTLMTELDGLHKDWQGRGGASFAQVKQEWADQQLALHRALAETAVAIRTAGQGYGSADDAAAQRITGTGSITLPL